MTQCDSGPEASAAPGKLSEMHILRPHSISTESEFLGVGNQPSGFNKPSGVVLTGWHAQNFCSQKAIRVKFLKFFASFWLYFNHAHIYHIFFLLKELLYTLWDPCFDSFLKRIISHMSFHFCTSCLRRLHSLSLNVPHTLTVQPAGVAIFSESVYWFAMLVHSYM